jgi:adenine-specific DNA-methyltransferase
VKLYWANQDQYYIKTAENFKDYTFKDGDLTVHFRLVDATTELNNNKESDDKKRVFMLYEETEERPDIKTIEQNGNELIIRFVFDVPSDKKRKYAEENAAKIVEAITKQYKEFFPIITPRFMDSKTKKQTKSLLDKHLEAYVAKNTFDYFIHKDLRGFLTRELDFYIKSEIIHLDDLDTINEKRVETYLGKVKAIKRVGKILIDFLAQIENFQKKLWLKKKFVIETNWCITLDKIDEGFYQEIIENKDQIQEWIDMYAINEIEGDTDTVGYSDPLTIDFLRQNPNLIVDTKHFTVDFKDRLIATINNIDEQTDGFMIHSDNYQALNLLQERYAKKIDGIYIDPPYNTDGMEIIYKNGYKDSSWIALMADRIDAGKNLLAENAILCELIDDAEYANLFKLMRQHMTGYSIRPVIIEYNHRGRVKSNFAYTHEYAVWAIPGGKDIITRQREISDDIRRNLRRTGTDSTRQSSPSMFYGIEVDLETLKIVGVTEPLELGEPIPVHENSKTAMIWPIDDNGIERRWYYGKDRIMDDVDDGTVWAKRIAGKIQIHYHQDGKPKYRKTLWSGPLMDSSTHGSELLNDIFGLGFSNFSFPKSIHAVEECINSMTYSPSAYFLDYFAGSGTTGHAVININRSDEGKRKYILVEMGEYFNTVTQPRIKKVVYSSDWKNGKPVNRNTGVSQIIKYIRLESYEDALSNIDLSEKGGLLNDLFGEDYLVNYMLDIESEGSLLKLDCFNTPFEYKLRVVEKNETKEKVIDLVETFNYLIGLSVASRSVVAYFNAVPDEKGAYEGAVRLVKDTGGRFAFKQVEGTLPDGRRALVIWRNITDNLIESNAALDAYFTKYRINPLDREYDVIYVNGDNNLENLRTDDEGWKVRMTEIDFKKHMFEGV